MKKYEAIDGLRAFGAMGIVMMHVLINGGYALNGFIGERVIPSFTDFVFLFMIVSAFGLCCGYYQKFIDGTINLELLYKRRFIRILPFFGFLSIVDVVLSPSKNALYELFANLTLMFGLLPNARITVIGVGWFLGVIFVFYICFPFFTVLLKTKKRAWKALAIALIFNVLCTRYFFDEDHVIKDFSGRTNIIYCSMFFIAGGLIYLYREVLEKINIWISIAVLVISMVAYYLVGTAYTCLLLSASLLIFALTWRRKKGILQSKPIHFIGGLSMEIYLCHMVFFRVVEKVGLTQIGGDGVIAYVITLILVFALATGFSYVMRKITDLGLKKLGI